MDDLFEEAATEGMDVDPISGNEIPEGVSGKNVRDDVDAKLSEGEFVIPAYAVKFFGVDYFEKLLKKAKKGNEELANEGRSEGEGLEMQMGGLVPAARTRGQVRSNQNMSTSQIQSPTKADNLINKDNMTEVDERGDFREMPSKEDLPSEEDKPQEMFIGGIVKKAKKLVGLGGGGGGGGGSSYEAPERQFGVGEYDPSNFMSKWNATDYGMGFSTRPEYSGNGPVKAAYTSKLKCPEGYVLDEKQNICVPVAQQKAQDIAKNAGQIRNPNSEGEPRTGDDREGTTGNSVRQPSGGQGDASKSTPGLGGRGFGGNWTSKFDYSDTDSLVNQTLTTLGSPDAADAKNDGTSRFGNIGESIVNGVVGRLGNSAVGQVLDLGGDVVSMRTASIANANAQYLDSIGKKKEAQQVRDAADKYAEDKGLVGRFGVIKDDYNGTQRFENAQKQGLFDQVKSLVSPRKTTTASTSQGGKGSAGTGSSSAPTTSVRPQARPSEGGVKSGNSSKGGYNAQGKSGNEGNPTGGDGSGGYDNNGKSGRAGTWAKGGIVKPRVKTKTVKDMETKNKAKKVSKGKKGLGRKTK